MNKKTILIAEDNDSNFMYLNILLRSKYHIIHAENGREAVEMAQSQHPDAILMDIKMPLMNGIEAIREIRKTLSLPIIIQSSFAFDQDIDEALAAGANSYLTKPILSAQLEAELSKYGI